ncbi:MAG: DsbA family oxidoreductase [Flavobacterium sp.]|nr:DsbA family oxidoreductase [Pedobacter sp.]
MKVNIWSDVRCPFCYIGKVKFEKALDQFPHKNEVEVIWKSFQLDPFLKAETNSDVYDYFSKIKGISRDHAAQMFENVTQVAKEVGLNFNLENSVHANSFNAHRLIQFAKAKNLGNEMEEELFKIYFIEGKDIDDKEVLIEAASTIGLPVTETRDVLNSDAYADDVKKDELEAQEIGVRGVPFFVFNDKFAISGAQSPEAFLQVLDQSWADFEKEQPLTILNGDSCTTEGIC